MDCNPLSQWWEWMPILIQWSNYLVCCGLFSYVVIKHYKMMFPFQCSFSSDIFFGNVWWHQRGKPGKIHPTWLEALLSVGPPLHGGRLVADGPLLRRSAEVVPTLRLAGLCLLVPWRQKNDTRWILWAITGWNKWMIVLRNNIYIYLYLYFMVAYVYNYSLVIWYILWILMVSYGTWRMLWLVMGHHAYELDPGLKTSGIFGEYYRYLKI